MSDSREQQKFNKIYNEHHRLVRRVLYNMVGSESLEDLTQEAFIKIWNGLPLFSFRSSLKTWVYRITINTAIDYLRKKKVSATELIEEQSIKKAISDITNEIELVEASLGILDEENRSIVILYYLEELSLKEIARMLNVPEGTVKSRLYYSKQKMKLFFAAKGVIL